MTTKYKQGIFKPKNPQKYKGDPNNIVYRSSWEFRMMTFLDDNPQVTKWSSEEVVIPYISPVDNRWHRYFIDFYVETTVGDTKKEMLLEVKPHAQTQEPQIPKRKTKRFITEVVTYGINQAKWKAAQEFCLDRGWEFKVVTEKDMFGKGK